MHKDNLTQTSYQGIKPFSIKPLQPLPYSEFARTHHDTTQLNMWGMQPELQFNGQQGKRHTADINSSWGAICCYTLNDVIITA